MGRFIREEDVKQEIDKWLDSVGTAYVGKGLSYYGELLGCIEDAPTAYDVEKVVEQLEKEKEIHTEHYNISLYKDYPDVKRRYEQMLQVIDKAIEIVKEEGGIE